MLYLLLLCIRKRLPRLRSLGLLDEVVPRCIPCWSPPARRPGLAFGVIVHLGPQISRYSVKEGRTTHVIHTLQRKVGRLVQEKKHYNSSEEVTRRKHEPISEPNRGGDERGEEREEEVPCPVRCGQHER